MTTPVQIIDKPQIHPHVCVVCGKQDGREYFVDTGIDIGAQYWQSVWEGRVYLCSLCMDSLVTDYYNKLNAYQELQAPKSESTYLYVNNGQLELEETDNGTGTAPGNSSGDSEDSEQGTAQTESGNESTPEGNDGDSATAESSDSESNSAEQKPTGFSLNL